MSITDGRANHIDRASLNIAQTIMYEVKTQRQVAYMPERNSDRFRYSKCNNEHVLAVELKVHAYSRSKHLTAYLHALGFSLHYSHILRIETQLAQAVISRMSETAGIYIPPGLQYGKSLLFAADNIDFSEDTHDGKNTLHATIMVAFQQVHNNILIATTLPISTKASSRSLKGYKGNARHESFIRGTPKPINSPKYPDYTKGQNMNKLKISISRDRSWLVVRYLQISTTTHINVTPMDVEEHTEDISIDIPDDVPTGTDVPNMHAIIHQQAETEFIPTWAAYNSIITDDERPITQIKNSSTDTSTSP